VTNDWVVLITLELSQRRRGRELVVAVALRHV